MDDDQTTLALLGLGGAAAWVFYVYSADGIPRLSDNLKYSYCRFYEQGGFE